MKKILFFFTGKLIAETDSPWKSIVEPTFEQSKSIFPFLQEGRDDTIQKVQDTLIKTSKKLTSFQCRLNDFMKECQTSLSQTSASQFYGFMDEIKSSYHTIVSMTHDNYQENIKLLEEQISQLEPQSDEIFPKMMTEFACELQMRKDVIEGYIYFNFCLLIKAMHLIVMNFYQTLTTKKVEMTNEFESFMNFHANMNKILTICSSENTFKLDFDSSGQTPMHLEAKGGNLVAFKTYLKYSADKNPSSKNSTNTTPLHEASKQGFYAIVEEICKVTKDINCLDSSNSSSLNLACKEGHFGVVVILLRHGAGKDLPHNQIERGGLNFFVLKALDEDIGNGGKSDF